MKTIIVWIIAAGIAVIIFLSVYLNSSSSGRESFTDPKVSGFVPDETTAIKIAEAAWLPVYGNSIYDQLPFNAELKDSIWYVSGSFNLCCDARGGVANIEINKFSGKIVRVYHTQ